MPVDFTQLCLSVTNCSDEKNSVTFCGDGKSDSKMALLQYVKPVDFAQPCLSGTNFCNVKNGVTYCRVTKTFPKLAPLQYVILHTAMTSWPGEVYSFSL